MNENRLCFTGSWSSIDGMYTLPIRAGIWIVSAAFVCASAFAGATECSGPVLLETRVQAHPDVGAFTALGVWFNENHQAECAIDAFQSALKIDSASPAAQDGLAKAQIAAGDYGAVISHLQNAKLDENLTIDLAAAYRMADLFDDAARVLTEGLKIYPASDGLTGALVSLDIHVSHVAAAQALAEKLARQKPRDLEAQRIYLRTLVINGDDAAAPLGRKLLALAPHDADLLDMNGFLERKAGDYPAARKHLAEAVALNPNYYYSHYNLGLVLAQLQDAAGAKEQLERAIALGAAEPEAHFELAKVLRALGETDAAQEQLMLYRQRLKEESDKSVAILKSTQAEEAAKAGDNQKAADLFREASAALPGNPSLAYRLALALNKLGDLSGERTALEEAVKTDPEFAQARYQLGYVELHSGEFAAAEEQFRLALKAAPKFVQAWVALAATLGMENRLQDAREAVANALQLEPKTAAALELSKKLAAAEEQH
jgi:tetratricopeptide (TPR) repeat protein